jgi:hypothetical protein
MMSLHLWLGAEQHEALGISLRLSSSQHPEKGTGRHQRHRGRQRGTQRQRKKMGDRTGDSQPATDTDRQTDRQSIGLCFLC